MEHASPEVRLFVQHLARWLGAFSHRQFTECHSIAEDLARSMRDLGAQERFRQHLTTRTRDQGNLTAPEDVAQAVFAFFCALADDGATDHYRSSQ